MSSRIADPVLHQTAFSADGAEVPSHCVLGGG